MSTARSHNFGSRRAATFALTALFAAAATTRAAAADDPFAQKHGRGAGSPPRVADSRGAAPSRSDGRVAAPARDEGRCGEPRGISLWKFPERPEEGGSLRFVAVAETPRVASLIVDGPNGRRVIGKEKQGGGPPHAWIAEIDLVEPGTYTARLVVKGDSSACAEAEVAGLGPPPRPLLSSSLWPVERVWDHDTENLYSIWVEKLFDDDFEEMPSWKSLHEVTRESTRNFLYDSLGLGEDSAAGISLQPDCADLPYFLRAYFAWKLRLPFMYSRCYSVSQDRAPICAETKSNLEPSPSGKETLAVLQRFFARSVADTAHSATGRTAAMDDRTDLYPVRIGADTLRPGTVFIDPYGHVLVISRRIDQTPKSSGMLLAIDAQPDGTVARKRYWRGNFLFALSENGAAPGFKRFRPVMPDGNGVRTLTNIEILDHPAYGDWSTEQYEGDADAFYDKVDKALSPQKRPVRQVVLEVIDMFEQQVLQRVASVQGGEDYMQKNRGVMSMPGGAAIFQTVGPWEDYATPSRDLRLLIAIDVVRNLPDTILRHPERYVIERGRSLTSVRGDIANVIEYELEKRTFQYQRTDGSPWTLKLSEVAERAEAIEMAYNPNDCVEKRWGAEAESIEVMTCNRHAPGEQVRMMQGYRDWFRTRTRPAT